MIYEPDTDRLEHWQYVNPLVFEINPETDFEFAKNIYKDCDIWNLFLAGSARIDYYEDSKTTLEQRIKYAIVEYMMRRPQFYSTNDFVDNEILHKKYKKNGKGENVMAEIIYVCKSINNKNGCNARASGTLLNGNEVSIKSHARIIRRGRGKRNVKECDI